MTPRIITRLGRRRGDAEPHKLVGKYRCRRCNRVKPLSEFYISRTRAPGHQNRCKDCCNGKPIGA